MMIELRPYQEAAIQAIYAYFDQGGAHPIVCLPTGSGKSVVIAEFIRRAITEWPETRILVLAHVPELLIQNAEELYGLWPQAPIGTYSASLNANNIKAQILFAGIQSIYKKAYHLQTVHLVLIDECHLLSPDSNTMYRRMLTDLLQINPYLRVIGLSATPFRLDSGSLTSGDDALFTDIVYEADILTLIEQGYLCPLVSKPTTTRLDVSGVATRGGEYVASDLERAVDQDDVTEAAVREIVEYGQDRRSWLVFCAGVAHAGHVRDAIRRHGISSEMICGKTPKGERRELLAAYKRGSLRSLTNANVLTTGINVRPIDLLAFLRPTKSAGLLGQMAGRGMRLSPETGKENCLILDFARLLFTHGPIDKLRGRDRVKGEGTAPVKECPNCHESVYASARQCPACGFEFPLPEAVDKLDRTAATLPVLSNQIDTTPPEWVEVENVTYSRHVKAGSPDSMKVTYGCGLMSYSEWVSVERTGYPRQCAVAWWRARAPGLAVPNTVTEALANAGALRKPMEIELRPDGKFMKVVGAKL